jgi:hypothetical protein
VTLAYVSGGSNLEPETNLVLAARAMKARHPGTRFSRCYRNVAIGFDGPDFINFVVELPVAGDPALLKGELECVETQCGRRRDAPSMRLRQAGLSLLLSRSMSIVTRCLPGRGPAGVCPRVKATGRVHRGRQSIDQAGTRGISPSKKGGEDKHHPADAKCERSRVAAPGRKERIGLVETMTDDGVCRLPALTRFAMRTPPGSTPSGPRKKTQVRRRHVARARTIWKDKSRGQDNDCHS